MTSPSTTKKLDELYAAMGSNTTLREAQRDWATMTVDKRGEAISAMIGKPIKFIEITDVEGQQVAEPVALALKNRHEWLSPTHTRSALLRLNRELRQREDKRRFPAGHPENWHDWWDAAAADPALAGHVAERARRQVEAGHHESESTLLATHVEALRAAGFAEVGTLWQRGDNRLLCAVMPGEAA